MKNIQAAVGKVGLFGRGVWRYWRFGEPAPESNHVVQKLYAYTDGRSNDLLFHILERRRRETKLNINWHGESIQSEPNISDPSIEEVVRVLKKDGIAVLAHRLQPDAIQNLCQLALTCKLETMTFAPPPKGQVPGTHSVIPIAHTGTSDGVDLSNPSASVYTVPRAILMGNRYIQSLLCDPYLLSIAAHYLGVFPVVTKPEMWWDTDCVASGLRPRPFHTDSGCLRWLKVGINLTATILDSPHFVYVKGSHRPNSKTRPLTKRLVSSMNLSDREVTELCAEDIVHVTASAGSITLADTRGIHKGELSRQGHRLILYFGLEGSAFNNIDGPIPVSNVEGELAKAMAARPFNYQFFVKHRALLSVH